MMNHRNLNLKLLLLAGMVVLSSIFCSRFVPQGDAPQPGTAEITPAAPEKTIHETIPVVIAAEKGSISGNLSYPSESIPPLRVVAFRVDNAAWYSVEIVEGGQFTLLNLPPGDYYVVSYLIDKSAIQGNFAGGYTGFIPCGMNVDCTDHSLIPVTVTAGKTTSGIHPGDWYAPENAFPPDPTTP